jgi:hypothetical protein
MARPVATPTEKPKSFRLGRVTIVPQITVDAPKPSVVTAAVTPTPEVVAPGDAAEHKA